MFVRLCNRSVDEALQMGKNMARVVSEQNPHPVILEFEKVYSPCLLVTKKRYCGTMYESKADAGSFDAKGIETVRRDSCPYVAKLEERSLKLLFRSNGDVDAVRADLEVQFERTLMGRVSVKDFVSSGKVRVGSNAYANEASLPPSAVVSHIRGTRDPRLAALNKQRVPYVVVHAPPGSLLREMVVHPEELYGAANPNHSHAGHRLNYEYYIVNLLRALSRLLELPGMLKNGGKMQPVMSWFRLMPKRPGARPRQFHFQTADLGAFSISKYLLNRRCRLCHGQLESEGVSACLGCLKDISSMIVASSMKLQSTQLRLARVVTMCELCTGHRAQLCARTKSASDVMCGNTSCELFYERMKSAEHFRDDYSFAQNVFP